MNVDVATALRARLARLWHASSFWRRRFEEAGFASAPEALDRLAVTTAEELAADELAHLPGGSWRDATAFSRAGVPCREQALGILLFTADDLSREARVGAGALRAAGLESGRRSTNTLPGAIATPGSLLVGDAVEALGSLDMPVGPIDTPASCAVAWDFWQRVQPDFAIVDAKGACDLAGLLDEKQVSATWLGLSGLAVVTDLRDSEPVTAGFDVPVTRIAGLAECFGLMCARSSEGAYFPPADEILVEVLDGQLVLTALVHSAALVRYAPGVRARVVGAGFETL